MFALQLPGGNTGEFSIERSVCCERLLHPSLAVVTQIQTHDSCLCVSRTLVTSMELWHSSDLICLPFSQDGTLSKVDVFFSVFIMMMQPCPQPTGLSWWCDTFGSRMAEWPEVPVTLKPWAIFTMSLRHGRCFNSAFSGDRNEPSSLCCPVTDNHRNRGLGVYVAQGQGVSVKPTTKASVTISTNWRKIWWGQNLWFVLGIS